MGSICEPVSRMRFRNAGRFAERLVLKGVGLTRNLLLGMLDDVPNRFLRCRMPPVCAAGHLGAVRREGILRWVLVILIAQLVHGNVDHKPVDPMSLWRLSAAALWICFQLVPFP